MTDLNKKTMPVTPLQVERIEWAKMGGMLPAIVQDARSARVLMLGYMNEAALTATLASGLATFFSRSKNRLWQKGETSGNVLRVRSVQIDCDGDALLVLADPSGPTCHTGTRSCFGEGDGAGLNVLSDLEDIIRQRRVDPQARSYTASLFEAGLSRIAQKVGEEGVEVALAGAAGADNLIEESADLLYHLLVLLTANDKSLTDVLGVLKGRGKG